MTALPHPEPLSLASFSAVELAPGDEQVYILDQRRLPLEEHYEVARDHRDVARAIRDMLVRGAPAIGIAAAYGMALAARHGEPLAEAGAELTATRPTAVNLMWAVARMQRVAAHASPDEVPARLAAEARQIHRDDVEACRAMGRLGGERIPDGATVLTHCNAGALATGGYGTALGVIRAAHESGKRVSVLADETRPYLQGARLTAWELERLGVSVRVIADVAAGHCFAQGMVDMVVVGSDRIAANGDVANKIGTYTVACLAQRHERAFFVAAPWSTVDLGCASGDAIPIEERSAQEVTHCGGRRVVAEGVGALNPAFDVTPAELVRAIFTERGTIEPVGPRAVAALASSGILPAVPL